ncbi:MAG: hypothetical protein ACD_28C00419G0002 [uncultured bacterium]|nr:MAG: hypothetical protein ACD_28C00419G0002 [uncultured bacterium]KKT74454.1 MAG: hypothetical protein UW70_C0054G0006 [Candidatus Peregrinibacteria bacterium GW2011_GWA2_44_7]
MLKIITTTQLQQKIGELSRCIKKITYIVTNRGIGKMVLLPYFDGCDENISNYMEDYEMIQNQAKLKKEFKKSLDSGKSSLVI